MTNVEKFLAVITAANVPVMNPVQRGSNILHSGDNIPNRPAPEGMQGLKGAFINIPVKSKFSYGEGLPLEEENQSIMIYQRYLDDQNLFTISGEPDPISREKFMIDSDGQHNFSNLEKLLNGETLKFTDDFDDNCWVEIQLISE